MLSRIKELWNAAQRCDSIERDGARITFSVDDVAPAAGLLWQSTLHESLQIRSGHKIIVMPDADIPALAAEGYGSTNRSHSAQVAPEIWLPLRQTYPRPLNPSGVLDGPRLRECIHPLVDAVHVAFSQHRPLTLSPDSIWLTIVQGFGHHVHENAEALRNRMVRHEGKKELRVTVTSLDADQIPGMVSQFSSLIHANSDPVLHETLMCDFSTTTPAIRTASEIALMDAYEDFFEYAVRCVCGIPKITLQGTPDDWQRMRERVEVLATYDLGWWVSRLIPILDEFVAAANGRPNRSFWQAIYKPKPAYGAEVATGWITDLFPYLGDPPGRRKNEMIETPRIHWMFDDPHAKKGGFPTFHAGIKPSSFPSGLSLAPLKVTFRDGSERQLDLLGGFFGVGQSSDDGALYPIISWALTERPAPPARETSGWNFRRAGRRLPA